MVRGQLTRFFPHTPLPPLRRCKLKLRGVSGKNHVRWPNHSGMSQHHLNDLHHALTQKGWTIVETLPGDDYRVSAVWVVARGDSNARLAFDGLHEIECLPIERSYACHLEGDHLHSVYFGKKSWKIDLASCVDGLNRVGRPT